MVESSSMNSLSDDASQTGTKRMRHADGSDYVTKWEQGVEVL